MQRLVYPFPLFLDQHGALLDAGRIFVGAANDDPELNPIDVFWDADLTVPASQPLKTRGGVIVNNGAPAVVYIDEDDYSVRVRDADNGLVSYARTATDIGEAGPAYQPADDDLTAIAALSTSTFGRSLLTLANVNELKSLLSLVASLSLGGGTVSGAIIRQSAGSHLYLNDPALTSGAVFASLASGSDPTTAPGQIWLKYV